MATQNTSAPLESRARYWRRVLRPLFWWFLLVLVLYALKIHQRLCEQTHLWFNPVLQGQSVSDEVTATLDKHPITSGTQIAIGRHRFTITHLKAEPFTTNLLIWYGKHDLGDIVLKRGSGSLVITASPAAALIDIHGPEFSLKLTNSSGTTLTVPTDRYTVDAYYQHWQRRQEPTVSFAVPGTCAFAPRFGTVQLTCNHSGASFQMLTTQEQLFEAGDFPATLPEVPEGSYKLNAWHHGNHQEQTLTVSAGNTTSIDVQFNYGAALLETEPPGATVYGAGGQKLGITPLQVSELSAGQWRFQIALNGYEGVTAALDVSAQATNTFRTNLVNLNFVRSLNLARQFLAESDYASAERAATDALQAKSGDADATAVYNEATGKRHLRQAEALGKQGDFVGGDKELTLVLQTLPENEEAKQLLAAFKSHESDQLQAQQQQQQQAALMNRPQDELAKLTAGDAGARYFEIHTVRTGKKLSDVAASLRRTLVEPPKFAIDSDNSPTSDVTLIVAKQSGAQLSRVCYLALVQLTATECQVVFKNVEYANDSPAKDGLLSVLNVPGTRDYVLLRPTQSGNWTQRQSLQIMDGVQKLTDRIQRAIDQSLAN